MKILRLILMNFGLIRLMKIRCYSMGCSCHLILMKNCGKVMNFLPNVKVLVNCYGEVPNKYLIVMAVNLSYFAVPGNFHSDGC
jgi:hypothetical protein